MKTYQTTFIPQRRGMILLLTLALLTMFSLLIVSFMFATSNMRRVAEAYGRLTYEDMKNNGEYGSSGSLDSAMDEAVTRLLVGRKPDENSPSVLVHQSLLESIYGHPVVGDSTNDKFKGEFDFGTPTDPDVSGDNIIAVRWNIADLFERMPDPDLAGHSMMDIIGNVLTVTNTDTTRTIFSTGEERQAFVNWLKNKSVRILMFCQAGTVLPPGLRDDEIVSSITGADNRVTESCFLINVKSLCDTLPPILSPSPPPIPHSKIKTKVVADLLNGCKYIINGAAFRGTGIGFDDAVLTTDPYNTPQQSVGYSYTVGSNSFTFPFALAPNPQGIYDGGRKFLELLSKGTLDDTVPDPIYYLTRMNVDYTAPDFNNIFLSWYNYDKDGMLIGIIPSFHRPAIVDYWHSHGKINDALDLQRLVLRPLPLIHPEFSGSNPVLANLKNISDIPDLINILSRNPDQVGAAYDVDTDADGLNDAYWMDIGLPVEYDPKSKQEYKPLVAITVRELDSRINVNYHGNMKHEVVNQYDYDLGKPSVYDNEFRVGADELIPRLGGKGENSIELFGEGAGPAEISLTAAFGDASIANRIFGDISVINEHQAGRYGIDKDASNNPVEPLPNAYGMTLVNLSNELRIPLEGYAIDDISTSLWLYDNAGRGIDRDVSAEFNGNAVDTPVAFSGRSPNLWGDKPQYIDILGNNVSLNPELFWGDDDPENNTVFLNNPYAIDYKSNTDKLFKSDEIETLFRLNDLDVKDLLPRLFNVVAATDKPENIDGDGTARNALRKLQEHITHSSYDVQSLPALIAPDATSIYSQVLKCVGGVGHEDEAAAFIAKFLPPEIMQGKKLDLNRLTREYGVINPRNADGTFNPAAYKEGLIARARFAEQLFYLLVVLSYDELYGYPYDGGLTPPTIAAYDGGEVLKAAITNDNERRQWMIARLAQWAVNFVDFTDPDDSMTPLLVPIDPFASGAPSNFWANMPSLTTKLLSDDATDVMETKTAVSRGNFTSGAYLAPVALFWGMERPNLVISETMALHNRGTADTTSDPTGKLVGTTTNDDDDYDQVMAPEPSLFVELHNIGSGNRPDAGLVSFMATALKADGTRDTDHPMWRLVVGKRENEVVFASPSAQTMEDEDNLFYLLSDDNTGTKKEARFTHSLQPKQSTLTADTVKRSNVLGASKSTLREIDIDRIIWLGPQNPNEQGHSYYWENFNYATDPTDPYTDNRVLAQNEYLTIGPRELTYLGRPKGNFSGALTTVPACQTLSLTGVGMVRQGNQPWREAAAIADGGTWDATADGNVHGNVSTEYKTMKYAIMKDVNSFGVNISGKLPSVSAYYTTPAAVEDTPRDMTTGAPLTDDGIYGDGTVQCYKPLFLQRLADPLRPYNSISNPYISVDYTMVDLTVYTGVEGNDTKTDGDVTRNSKLWNEEQKKFGTNSESLDFANDTLFHSQQLRGTASIEKGGAPIAGVLGINPWKGMNLYNAPLQPSIASSGLLQTGETSMVVSYGIDHGKTATFGYLNYAEVNVTGGTPPLMKLYPIPATPIPASSANPPFERDPLLGLTGDERRPYVGAPWDGKIADKKVSHFNTPTWNNAPLVSSYDSLNVPASAPGRFGLEYLQTEVNSGGTTSKSDLYNADKTSSLGYGGTVKLQIPAHLLNFFVSATPSSDTTPPEYKSLNLARLFDFAGLQSKFNGTVEEISPTNLTYATTYREPGKVNINMITETEWKALTHNSGVPNEFADTDITKSDTFSDALHNNNDLEQFPFRAASTSFLRPYVMDTPDDDLLARAFLSDSTLLRPVYKGASLRHDNILDAEAPLFAHMLGGTMASRSQYYPMSRLSEMTTSRSNVFAVWITVGRFAVSRKYENHNDWKNNYVDGNPVATALPALIALGSDPDNMFHSLYPDGRMLKEEIGTNGKGEVIRRREFLIIDRTDPVGFRRGEKLNSGDTIKLRRAL
ncbi:MAG: hypothetical protein LBU65_02855 [Planctomycetaceae bacterium]|nr:hypothetical protein [Planctomycetaceae bacterium]